MNTRELSDHITFSHQYAAMAGVSPKNLMCMVLNEKSGNPILFSHEDVRLAENKEELLVIIDDCRRHGVNDVLKSAIDKIKRING